jgi:DNA-binding PadR family transcriptional regulator
MNRMAAKQLRSGMVRRRRLYELTARGASVLEQLRGEWRRFSTGVQAVVGGPA